MSLQSVTAAVRRHVGAGERKRRRYSDLGRKQFIYARMTNDCTKHAIAYMKNNNRNPVTFQQCILNRRENALKKRLGLCHGLNVILFCL